MVTQAQPSVPLVAQFQPSQAGIYIVGFTQPHGLHHCADIVGVTHAFIAPSLLNLPPQSRLVTEVHDFALIIDFEAHEHTPMELGCVIINREYEIVGEYCRTASPATAPSIKGAYSYALTGLSSLQPCQTIRHERSCTDASFHFSRAKTAQELIRNLCASHRWTWVQ